MLNTVLARALLNFSISSTKYAPLVATANLHTAVPMAAARKGTRARKEAIKKANKKKKVEEEVKNEFIPFDIRLKMQKFGKVTPRCDYSWKPPVPADDVYSAFFFQWRLHSIEEAVQFHRETHHPTVYNLPDSPLFLRIELSLSTNKRNRYVDNIGRVLALPHQFPTGQERQLAVLTDCAETRTAVQEMGAHLVGGKEVVKLVLAGDIDLSQYDFVISSLDILPDLVPIRGLLKKSFPTPKAGTAVQDIPSTVERFMMGLQYEAIRDKYDLDYAHIHASVGTLSMPMEHIIANIEALLKDIDSHRSTRKTTDLITTIRLECPPISEVFYLDYNKIIGQQSTHSEEDNSADGEAALNAVN